MTQKIYLKIPVNRNGFKDPPKIRWSSQKEAELWDFISHAKRNEIDWQKMSEKFQVPVTFLQQQTYWMYEKQLEQLRNTIEKGTLSDESVRYEKSEGTIEESKSSSFSGVGLFGKRDDNQSKNTIKDYQEVTNDYKNDDNSEDSYSPSTSTSSSSDDDNINHGSMLLQRSRILSKLPPRFKDLDEDDQDERDNESETKKTNTESSMSNLSCMYTKLELFSSESLILTIYTQPSASANQHWRKHY